MEDVTTIAVRREHLQTRENVDKKHMPHCRSYGCADLGYMDVDF